MESCRSRCTSADQQCTISLACMRQCTTPPPFPPPPTLRRQVPIRQQCGNRDWFTSRGDANPRTVPRALLPLLVELLYPRACSVTRPSGWCKLTSTAIGVSTIFFLRHAHLRRSVPNPRHLR